jgi:hypothetical protein
MRQLFLVTGTVSCTPYMTGGHSKSETRLVWADTDVEATAKFTQYFERLSESYAVSYTVRDVNADPAIE